MKSLAPMDLEFLTNPPESLDFMVEIAASPEDVFDVVADTDKLGLWLSDFKSARWLTDPPAGVDSRREVKLRLIAVEERFVVWERPKRFAFVMEAISLPIVAAMGEDMRIESKGDRRSVLRWRVAYAPTLLGKVLRPAARVVLSKLFRDSLARLKALVERGG
jgi:uncharacterized protein YndB with AHSA1/START domain